MSSVKLMMHTMMKGSHVRTSVKIIMVIFL